MTDMEPAHGHYAQGWNLNHGLQVKTLRCVYDLKHAPITYDFVIYLVIADCVRQIWKYDDIHLTIITDEFRRVTPRDLKLGETEKRFRIKNCILDNIDLLPTVTKYEVLSRRPDNQQFDWPTSQTPPYTPAVLAQLVASGANPFVLKAPTTPFKLPDPGYITLTLRTSHNFPERNVSISDWWEFYHYLKNKGETVLVIPDMEDDLADRFYSLYAWPTHLGAAYDVRFRLALYENAKLNIASTNGPTAMLWYTGCPVLMFDQLRGGTFSHQMLTGLNGVPPGMNYPWARPDQRMIPKDSTLDNLVEAYELFHMK